MNDFTDIAFDIGVKFAVFIFFVFQGLKAGYQRYFGTSKYLTPEQATKMVDDAQVNLAKTFGAQEDNLKRDIKALEKSLEEVKTESMQKDKKIADLQRDVKELTAKSNSQNEQIVDLFNRLEEKETALKVVSQDLKKARDAQAESDKLYHGEKKAKEAVLETIGALQGVVSAFQITPIIDTPNNNEKAPTQTVKQTKVSETLIDETSKS